MIVLSSLSKKIVAKKHNNLCLGLVKPSGVNFIKLFFSLLAMRPNMLECLHLAKTLHSSLTFAGNTRSLPKKEASVWHSNWIGSGLALKF